jgi:hypothetical protein
VGAGPATPRGSPNKNHLHGLQGGCQNGTGRSGSSRRSVTAGQAGAYGGRGRSPTDGAAIPRGSGDDRAFRAAGADCQDEVQALAQEILRRGAAAMAAGAASAGQGAQRPEGEAGARASRGATQPSTMPPPPMPTRTSGAPVATTGPPATTTGPQVSGGPPGPTLPTTAMRPEDQRPQGIRPPAGPSVVTRFSSKVEFNAGMSRDDVIIALLGFLQPVQGAAGGVR